jgi:hypothetical protein
VLVFVVFVLTEGVVSLSLPRKTFNVSLFFSLSVGNLNFPLSLSAVDTKNRSSENKKKRVHRKKKQVKQVCSKKKKGGSKLFVVVC